MKMYHAKKLGRTRLKALCERRPLPLWDDMTLKVRDILAAVKAGGDQAIRDYTARFDSVRITDLTVSKEEISQAISRLPDAVKNAFQKAAINIERFHKAQISPNVCVRTMPGVCCFSETRPIEKVGLYVPGGTAPLASTVLMLGVPARLAGCKDIVLLTPPARNGHVDDAIIYAASLCGIDRIFKIGGAQAIAALAYGTESVPKVYKIFGPGNQYVTIAKMLVSIDPKGAAIDMPSGPTEVLVIADDSARADFVASDLLAQAEHGPDSSPIFVTTSCQKAEEILAELKTQLRLLPRKKIAQKSLNNGFALVTETFEEAIDFANMYSPEHLILNVARAERYVSDIRNAGCVFLGGFSCESAGDYASGTNHSLPTYGFARAYSGLSVGSFQKCITFQKITKRGAKNIGPIVADMASQESLEGHKRAMQLRYQK